MGEIFEDKIEGQVADLAFCEEVYPLELYRGAQPSDDQLKLMAGNGIKTVIDLRGSGDAVIDESKQASKLGMNFIHFPMGIFCPSKKAMDKLMNIISNPENQPVFIHCLLGRDRTGAAVACYKMSKHGVPYKEANQDRKDHEPGFWSVSLDDSLKYYR